MDKKKKKREKKERERGFNPGTSALNLTNRSSPECHCACSLYFGGKRGSKEAKNKMEKTRRARELRDRVIIIMQKTIWLNGI